MTISSFSRWIWAFVLAGFLVAELAIFALAPAGKEDAAIMLIARNTGSALAALGLGFLAALIYRAIVRHPLLKYQWWNIASIGGAVAYLFLVSTRSPVTMSTEPAAVDFTASKSTPAVAAGRQSAVPGLVAGLSPGASFRDCEVCPEMVVIPSGSFTMGSPRSEAERLDREGPQHQVRISRPPAVGRYEVTRAQFAQFVQEARYSTGSGCYVWTDNEWKQDASKDWRNPGFSQSDKHPVTCVSWSDAKAYVDWVSRKTGRNYRLLTEAEWEYVARAGTTTPFSTGPTIKPTQANYDTTQTYAGGVTGQYRPQTAPVGSFQPNAFGLYDVHGNAYEWVEDCLNDSYDGAPSDGSAWIRGECSRRVARGGSWGVNPRELRSAFRGYANPMYRTINIGLRVARTD